MDVCRYPYGKYIKVSSYCITGWFVRGQSDAVLVHGTVPKASQSRSIDAVSEHQLFSLCISLFSARELRCTLAIKGWHSIQIRAERYFSG